MPSKEPESLAQQAGSGREARHKLIVGLIGALVVAMWAVVSPAALHSVEVGEVAPLTLVVTLASLVLAVIAVLMRTLSGARATVLFFLAAADFALAAWQWQFPLAPALAAAASAFALLMPITVLRTHNR